MVKYKTGDVGGRVFEVWLGDEKEMRELGKKWMKDDEFHEVISFPLDEIGPGPDGEWRLGDVVIYKRAKNRDFFIVHGIEHLLGRHHD